MKVNIGTVEITLNVNPSLGFDFSIEIVDYKSILGRRNIFSIWYVRKVDCGILIGKNKWLTKIYDENGRHKGDANV